MIIITVAIVINGLVNDSVRVPNASPAPAAGATSGEKIPAGGQDFVRVATTGTDSPSQATVYFGQLDRIMTALQGHVSFNTDESYRRAHSTLCASTVVFTGVPGVAGEVFAERLGEGWRAAEKVPDNRVSGPDDNLHQQLITPPASAVRGQSWTLSAVLMQSGRVVARSGDYKMTLVDDTRTPQLWSVEPGGQVTCSLH